MAPMDPNAALRTAFDLGFPLIAFARDRKGPQEKDWPSKVLKDCPTADGRNFGVITGRPIAPGHCLADVDVDWTPGATCAEDFLPRSLARFGRASKRLSHAFYTTAEPVITTVYKDTTDGKVLIELRGRPKRKKDGAHQTMLPPSTHPETSELLEWEEANFFPSLVDAGELRRGVLLAATAMLIARHWPAHGRHDLRLAYARVLLSTVGLDGDTTRRVLRAACLAGGSDEAGIQDVEAAVLSTESRLQEHDPATGAPRVVELLGDEVGAKLLRLLCLWHGVKHASAGGLFWKAEDFWGYSPAHTYLFLPTREMWPGSSVSARVFPVRDGEDESGNAVFVPASLWIDRNRSTDQMTWFPGKDLIIEDQVFCAGVLVAQPGARVINTYREPAPPAGDAAKADPWVKLVRHLYPEHWAALVQRLAHRVQHPDIKVNHAVVLGGGPGIGKDSLLEPVKTGVGPWNFAEASPAEVMGRFNAFLKSVILRVSEARDLGDVDRYAFYEHIKTMTASPPDVLMVDEKHLRAYPIPNVTFIVYTTNRPRGLYLPADDRRHFVLWSPASKESITAEKWTSYYHWLNEEGGRGHVTAFLSQASILDGTHPDFPVAFNPKAAPEQTDAFWTMVDGSRGEEDDRITDALEILSKKDQDGKLVRPVVISLADLKAANVPGLAEWLSDPANSKAIPHKLEDAGYVPLINRNATGDNRYRWWVKCAKETGDAGLFNPDKEATVRVRLWARKDADLRTRESAARDYRLPKEEL